jgi:hypothetical protein
MTRRPAQHVMSEDFKVVARDRLRAGVVERLVAVKRAQSSMPGQLATGGSDLGAP